MPKQYYIEYFLDDTETALAIQLPFSSIISIKMVFQYRTNKKIQNTLQYKYMYMCIYNIYIYIYIYTHIYIYI